MSECSKSVVDLSRRYRVPFILWHANGTHAAEWVLKIGTA